MTWESLAQLANTLSVVLLLVIAIWAGNKGIWVFKIHVEPLILALTIRAESAEKREAWWKDAFFRLADAADAQAAVTKTLSDEVIARTKP